jgi:ribosome-binding factor A
MTSFSRAERVSGEIQRILAEILHKSVKDPRLRMATITGVKMSPDLRLAKIYFSVTGGDTGRAGALQGFHSAAAFVKRELSKKLYLRYMPELRFYYDDSFDYGDHIEKLLKTIKKENGTDHTPIDE